MKRVETLGSCGFGVVELGGKSGFDWKGCQLLAERGGVQSNGVSGGAFGWGYPP